jgi:hypothetical protein
MTDIMGSVSLLRIIVQNIARIDSTPAADKISARAKRRGKNVHIILHVENRKVKDEFRPSGPDFGTGS